MHNHSKNTSWRDFQSEIQLASRKKKALSRLFKLLVMVLLCVGAMIGINGANIHVLPDIVAMVKQTLPLDALALKGDPKAEEEAPLPDLTRKDLKALLDPSLLFNAETSTLVVDRDIDRYTIETTLDPAFQRFLTTRLEKLKTLTRGKPQRIGLVAMDPATGKIVAMAGFDLADPKANPCTMGNYPAASVFKIVTASAAVESMGYTPQTPMYFNGGKYTLYKRQLKEKKNRYTTRVTLASAFAESINPVFGKIASTRLDKEKLQHYAAIFGFNQEVDSDFPFDAGKILIKDNAYQQAEVGCGFNKTTTISPMFGAMLSATIVNQGKPPLPSLVKTVTDANGAVIYTNKPAIFENAIEPATARAVMTMMEKTITSGTAKKSFRRFKRDSTLSRLEIGGKTGSLYNEDNTVKYDWFTGFAKEKNGDKALALAVVVGHRKYIGTRAASYGKMMFKHYFKSYFASTQTLINNG